MAHTASDSLIPSSRYSHHRVLIFTIIFAVALGVRGCAVLSQPETPIADAADYHQIAASLAEGRGYVNTAGHSTAWRPPGYPAFLALIYRLTGPSVAAATIVQSFVGALTVLMLMLFGSTFLNHIETVIGGVIAAAYPGFVWLPRLLLSENLSLLLTLTTLWAVAMYLKSRRVKWLVLFGAVGGLNTLVRGGNLVLPIMLGAGLLIVAVRGKTDQWKHLSTGLLLALAAFVVTVTPWTIRNYRVFHRFVPVATQEGLTLYASYWPPVKNGKFIWGTLPGIEDPNIAAANNLPDEVATSKYLQHITVERLRRQPSYFFRVIPSKMISLLVPFDWEILPHPIGMGRRVNWGYILIAFPALLGFILLCRNRRPNQWLLWVIPILVLVQTIVFYGSPRFRLPAEPIAILVAAVALSQLVRSRPGFLKTRPPLLG
jgi:4-amino-4-deoxy-L-arabinose transferase-like glycosyltransferase